MKASPRPKDKQHGERVRIEEGREEEQRREQTDNARGLTDGLVIMTIMLLNTGATIVGRSTFSTRAEERREDPGQARVAFCQREHADDAQDGQDPGDVADAIRAAAAQNAQDLSNGELEVGG